MGWTYRNRNGGNEVVLPERSRRLDALANWDLTSRPEPGDEPKEQAPPAPPEPPTRPADSAPKAAWIAWAVQSGADQADAEKATKPELITQYGGEGDL